MRFRMTAGFAITAALSVPALGESPLVLMDANDAIVGEVLSTDQSLTSAEILYRLDTGGFAVWTVTGGDYEDPFVFSYFALAGCAGAPLFEIAPGPARMATYYHRMTWLPGVAPIAIMRYPTASPGSSMTTRSYYHPTSSCVNTGDVARTVVPAEFVENLRYYDGPVHIELNPVLFRDGFQTGNLSRWSN